MDSLVYAARSRNELLGITGLLVFTGGHFARFLEETADSMDLLMLAITRDDRHQSVRSSHKVNVCVRIFPAWSLAFSGLSTYVDRHIRPLFAIYHDDLPGARNALIELLTSLSAAGED